MNQQATQPHIHFQRLFLPNAPGGTGQTCSTTAIQRSLKFKGRRILAAASSAFTAQLLHGGHTAHSALKIPISIYSKITGTINGYSQLVHKLRTTQLVIWGEIVMAHRLRLEAVDCTLRDLRPSTLPSERTFMLFVGDFPQTLSVVRAANGSQIAIACCMRSRLYPLLKYLHLQENVWLQAHPQDPHATPDALQFLGYILHRGDGKLQTQENQPVQLSASVKELTDEEELVLQIFPNLQ